MKITLTRGYGGFNSKAFITNSKVWVPRKFATNWPPDTDGHTSTPPIEVECELPEWFIKKYPQIK